MKNTIVILVLGLCTFCFAQNPKSIDIGEFSEIKVFDRMMVNLIQSDVNKVVIKGEDIEDVVVLNKNGKLKIRMEFEKIFDGDRTFVEVYHTGLEIIDANEGAQVFANEMIEQDYIELSAQEGARIDVGLNVEFLEAKAVTGGRIVIRGKSVEQKVDINTGGIYDARGLETETTMIKVMAGGEATVFATVKAEVKVRAGGDIDIYGNPKEVIKNTFVGGRINVM